MQQTCIPPVCMLESALHALGNEPDLRTYKFDLAGGHIRVTLAWEQEIRVSGAEPRQGVEVVWVETKPASVGHGSAFMKNLIVAAKKVGWVLIVRDVIRF